MLFSKNKNYKPLQREIVHILLRLGIFNNLDNELVDKYTFNVLEKTIGRVGPLIVVSVHSLSRTTHVFGPTRGHQ